jgi:methylated-DNA-protein-cysteine methyltransferase-like protein
LGYFEDIQRTVLQVPRGRVATYGEVARAAGYPGTARQVAWALRDAEARGIPWQRVLGRNGKILLPGEAGLYQRTLLEIEGVRFLGNRADMRQCGHRFKQSRAGGTQRAGGRPGARDTGTGYAARKRRSLSGG